MVDMDEEGERPLLEWVLRRYPQTPRTRAKQWIVAGRVSVGGEVVRQPHQRLADPGERLELLERHAPLGCGSGWQIHPRVELLHLDGALAVVNKGAGLLSVPAPNNRLCALSIVRDFLAGRLKWRGSGGAGRGLPGAYRRLEPLAVHRLDQYTSGVFCVALNPVARLNLIEQLRTHTMGRQYIAFVEGRPAASRGTWRQWLEMSDDETRQQALSGGAAGRSGRSGAREAVTHYEAIEEYPLAGGRVVTKLRLRLETGLKHQIRVQAASAGVPLIGDRKYHPRYRDEAAPEGRIEFGRQALHAEVLTLEHPEQTGKQMTWRAELPKDLRQLEAALKEGRV